MEFETRKGLQWSGGIFNFFIFFHDFFFLEVFFLASFFWGLVILKKLGACHVLESMGGSRPGTFNFGSSSRIYTRF